MTMKRKPDGQQSIKAVWDVRTKVGIFSFPTKGEAKRFRNDYNADHKGAGVVVSKGPDHEDNLRGILR